MADFKIAGAYVEFGERGFDKVKADISGLRGALESLKRNLSFGNIMGGVGGGILAASGIKSAFSTALSFVTAIPKAMVSGAAEMETYTEQWRTLLGDMGKAEGMMGRLARFADVTPFELPEVVNAAKLFQVFGEGTLNTERNLTLVGDAASATGNRFEEVAFWVARAYSMMKEGQPFGEAALRLQEMGIMTGKTRREVEYLSRTFPGDNKAFERLLDSLRPFSGGMERQSRTIAGLWSTIKDSAQRAATEVGQTLSPAIKNAETKTISFFQKLSSNKGLWEGTAKRLGDAFEKALEALTPERIDAFTRRLASIPAQIESMFRAGGFNRFINDLANAIGAGIAAGIGNAIPAAAGAAARAAAAGAAAAAAGPAQRARNMGPGPGEGFAGMGAGPNAPRGFARDAGNLPQGPPPGNQQGAPGRNQFGRPFLDPNVLPTPADQNRDRNRQRALADDYFRRGVQADPRMRGLQRRREETERRVDDARAMVRGMRAMGDRGAIDAWEERLRSAESARNRAYADVVARRRDLRAAADARAARESRGTGEIPDVMRDRIREQVIDQRLADWRRRRHEPPRFLGLEEMWKSIQQSAANPRRTAEDLAREAVEELNEHRRLQQETNRILDEMRRNGGLRFAN